MISASWLVLCLSFHTDGWKQRWRQQSPCFLRGRYPTFSFYRPNHTTKGNMFYLYGTDLSVFMPMVQEVWKVGVPQICFRFGRLPVRVSGSTGFDSIQHDSSFKGPYSLSDPGGRRNIWDLLHKSFQMMSIFFEDHWENSALLKRETSIEKPYNCLHAYVTWLCPISSDTISHQKNFDPVQETKPKVGVGKWAPILWDYSMYVHKLMSVTMRTCKETHHYRSYKLCTM